MKLAAFFHAVAPYYQGQQSLTDTVQQLGDVDARRLSLYGRFCALHRDAVLEGIYPQTRRHTPPRQWQRLSQAYFAGHPTTDWELNFNAPAFVPFLQQRVGEGLPAWLWELADLEWWQFATFVAADEKVPRCVMDSLHPTLMLRPYGHDVVDLQQDEGKRAPLKRACVMRIHRDSGLDIHCQLATAAELAVIKAVVERVALKDAAAASGLALRELQRARKSLVEEGALVGRRLKR